MTTPQTPNWYDPALEETACLTSVTGPEAQGREMGHATAESLDLAHPEDVAKLGDLEVRWCTFPLRVELSGWGRVVVVPREALGAAAGLMQAILAVLPLETMPGEEREEATSTTAFLEGFFEGLASRLARLERTTGRGR